MAKYNVVQKNKRQWKQDRKRAAHGEPGTGKLKQRTAPVSMSGKRKRKLERRLNRVSLVDFLVGRFLVRWFGLSDVFLVAYCCAGAERGCDD
jgi:hypothetical protein